MELFTTPATERCDRPKTNAELHSALLVSVRDADEAREALRGGCDILDVKEPARGSLGLADPVAICRVLNLRDEQRPEIPVSVALGEAIEAESRHGTTELRLSGGGGIEFVKLGTAGLGGGVDWRLPFERARQLWESRIESPADAPSPRWVAVAYADWQAANSPHPSEVTRGAAECGCSGLLIDTFGKSAGGLFQRLRVDELESLAGAARQSGLWFALAGRLGLADIALLHAIAPDVVGIRTAACHLGRREGRIDAHAIQEFRGQLCQQLARLGEPASFRTGPVRQIDPAI